MTVLPGERNKSKRYISTIPYWECQLEKFESFLVLVSLVFGFVKYYSMPSTRSLSVHQNYSSETFQVWASYYGDRPSGNVISMLSLAVVRSTSNKFPHRKQVTTERHLPINYHLTIEPAFLIWMEELELPERTFQLLAYLMIHVQKQEIV